MAPSTVIHLRLSGGRTQGKPAYPIWCVDGIILCPREDAVEDVYLGEVWDRGIPLVTVDHELPKTHAEFVGTENAAGGRPARYQRAQPTTQRPSPKHEDTTRADLRHSRNVSVLKRRLELVGPVIGRAGRRPAPRARPRPVRWR